MNWRDTRTASIAGALLLVVLLLAGGWWVWQSNRQAQARDALLQLKTAPSFHVDSELILNLPVRLRNRERPITQVTAKVAGDVKKNEHGTPELTGTVYVGGAGPGSELYADGDLRIFNDSVAFKLNKLSLFVNPSGSLAKRWTRVEAPLLQTHNSDAIQQTLTAIVRHAEYAGREEWRGKTAWHYNLTLAAEQKRNLIAVLQKGASGNQAFHVVARLLQANDVQSLALYVDPGTRQLSGIQAVFVKPLKNGSVFERARLSVALSDYGKAVTFDNPPRQLTVRQEVFARLFGSGEIEPQ